MNRDPTYLATAINHMLVDQGKLVHIFTTDSPEPMTLIPTNEYSQEVKQKFGFVAFTEDEELSVIVNPEQITCITFRDPEEETSEES